MEKLPGGLPLLLQVKDLAAVQQDPRKETGVTHSVIVILTNEPTSGHQGQQTALSKSTLTNLGQCQVFCCQGGSPLTILGASVEYNCA